MHMMQYRPIRIGTPPIPGFGISENGRNPETAIANIDSISAFSLNKG